MNVALITFDLDLSWGAKLKEAFQNLTTATCEIAAEMYVNACVKEYWPELENLLLQVPAEVGKRELYLSLAKAMQSTKGHWAVAVDFMNLLEWAADDKELGSEGAIELVELYSHYCAHHKVIEPDHCDGIFQAPAGLRCATEAEG